MVKIDFSRKRRSSSPAPSSPSSPGVPPGFPQGAPPGFPFHLLNPGASQGFPLFNPFLPFPGLQLPTLIQRILNQSIQQSASNFPFASNPSFVHPSIPRQSTDLSSSLNTQPSSPSSKLSSPSTHTFLNTPSSLRYSSIIFKEYLHSFS